MSGHFAYFKLVIDLVDGKVRPTAEDEMTFEAECVVVCAQNESDVECPVGTKSAGLIRRAATSHASRQRRPTSIFSFHLSRCGRFVG